MAVIPGLPRLHLAHRHLYRRELHSPRLTSWLKLMVRASIVVAGTLLLALLLPFVPSRHAPFPATLPAYGRQLLPASVVAVVVGAAAFRQLVWQHWPGRQPTYRWVGEFVVTGKESLLGKTYLWVAPGDQHKVLVSDQLYQALEKGDKVRLIYNAEYELLSVVKQ